MKIGFFGGLANNMYIMARAFHSEGHDIVFVRDRTDNFAFSQPVWEDLPFTLSYDEVMGSSQWSRERWSTIEDSLGWKAPDWVYDPSGNGAAVHTGFASGTPLPVETVVRLMETKTPVLASAREALSSCDVAVVCGIVPAILGALSGKPFVFWPHGSDLRTAAGVEKNYGKAVPQKIAWRVQQMVLKWAVAKAAWVAVEPMGSYDGSVLRKVNAAGFRVFHLPLVMPAGPDGYARSREEVLQRLGISLRDGSFLIFIPSRMDFFWKGTDRFLRAFIRLVRDFPEMHLVCAGWGKDMDDARSLVEQAGARDHVTFLGCSLSKPLLYEVHRISDLVVDQFVLGSYGTSTLEALSVGKPVMLWINEQEFRSQGLDIPPVFNCRDEKDIERTLRNILSGGIDLSRYSETCRAWVGDVHGCGHVVESFIRGINGL